MKVVIDTNVVVSGIFWSGPPNQILKAWQMKKIHVVLTEAILEEYLRVIEILSEKNTKSNFLPIIDLLVVSSEICIPAHLPKQISNDIDDDKFIACAIAAKSNVIISGDRDLLDVSGQFDIRVVTPRVFVETYL